MPKAQQPVFGFIGLSLGESRETPVEQPFATPADVKAFAGEGATEADLRRGFLESGIKDSPQYDKANYNDRWTEVKRPESDDASYPDQDDFNFRMKDRESRGFTTRPRIPTER